MPGHGYSARYQGIQSELVRFDTATFQVTGRVDIGFSRNREIAISPDGKLAAIATGLPGPIPIVDLDTFTVRSLPNSDETRGLMFTADSSAIVATGTQSLRSLKVADGTVTKRIEMPLPPEKTFHGDFGPDGRFWVGRENTLAAFDLTAGTTETFSIESAIMEVIGGKIWATSEGSSSIYPYDATGTQIGSTSLDFNDGSYGHWLGHSPF